jgi:hypothetical protein
MAWEAPRKATADRTPDFDAQPAAGRAQYCHAAQHRDDHRVAFS